jgi:hypothetical protein
MTDEPTRPTESHPADELPVRRTIVVGAPRDDDDAVVPPLVSTGDLGSASRSCLAIIIVLLVIALMLCVFLTVQTFR